MLAVAASHPFARRGSVSMEDLSRDVLITAKPAPDVIPDYYWEATRVPRTTPSGRPITFGPAAATFQEMLALAGAGKGMLVVGAQTKRYFPRPDIVYLPFRDAPLLDWGLVWRATGETTRVRAFAQVAHEVSRAGKAI